MPTDHGVRLERALDELSEALADLGKPVRGNLEPGLRPEITRYALAGFSLNIPEEVLIWFKWANGAKRSARQPLAITPHAPYSLPFAMHERIAVRRGEKQTLSAAALADLGWRESWVPLLGFDGTYLVAEFGRDDVAPMTCSDRDEGPISSVPSMLDMVTWWLRALREGVDEVREHDILINREWQRSSGYPLGF